MAKLRKLTTWTLTKVLRKHKTKELLLNTQKFAIRKPMSELTSNFSRDDLETLISATDDWERVNNQDYHIMQSVKNMPMPPEDHEAFEFVEQIKDHFNNRERDIELSRETRAEKAVFLKAKLMMVRRDLGIDQLFEMAGSVDADSPMPAAPKEVVPVPSPESVKIPATSADGSTLEVAEFFIKDLGVWDHYQKFLAERPDQG